MADYGRMATTSPPRRADEWTLRSCGRSTCIARSRHEGAYQLLADGVDVRTIQLVLADDRQARRSDVHVRAYIAGSTIQQELVACLDRERLAAILHAFISSTRSSIRSRFCATPTRRSPARLTHRSV